MDPMISDIYIYYLLPFVLLLPLPFLPLSFLSFYSFSSSPSSPFSTFLILFIPWDDCCSLAIFICKNLVSFKFSFTGHPRFFNQLSCGLDLISMAGEWLTATANTNMFTYEIAPVFILMENVVMTHMRELIGSNWKNGDSILAPGKTKHIFLFLLNGTKLPFLMGFNFAFRGLHIELVRVLSCTSQDVSQLQGKRNRYHSRPVSNVHVGPGKE